MTRLLHRLLLLVMPWYRERDHIARVEDAQAKLRRAEAKERGAYSQADMARQQRIKVEAALARAKVVRH